MGYLLASTQASHFCDSLAEAGAEISGGSGGGMTAGGWWLVADSGQSAESKATSYTPPATSQFLLLTPLIHHLASENGVVHLGGRDLILGHRHDVLREHDDVGVLP